jgi:hypothetical protein
MFFNGIWLVKFIYSESEKFSKLQNSSFTCVTSVGNELLHDVQTLHENKNIKKLFSHYNRYLNFRFCTRIIILCREWFNKNTDKSCPKKSFTTPLPTKFHDSELPSVGNCNFFLTGSHDIELYYAYKFVT